MPDMSTGNAGVGSTKFISQKQQVEMPVDQLRGVSVIGSGKMLFESLCYALPAIVKRLSAGPQNLVATIGALPDPVGSGYAGDIINTRRIVLENTNY